MKGLQALSALVAILGTIGAVFYTATNNEAQGAVVVLLAVLWMLALPHIVKS